MFELIYLDQARADFKQIAEDIARSSGSIETGLNFIDKLDATCRDLADKPFKMGHPRSDLGIDYHSRAVGDYLIFFRYDDDATRMEVITVIHGRRDLPALFDEFSR